MATMAFQPYDPLKKIQPVQPKPPSLISNAPGAPAPQLAQRPAALPAVRMGTPGPVPGGSITAPPLKPESAAGQTIRPVAQPPSAPAQPAMSGLGYSLYGSSGGTSSSAPAGSLESGLRDYITGAFGGTTSKKFVDSAKSQLGASVEGQRAQAVNQINDDAIRRGLFRSGIPAEATAAAGRAASGSLASGISDILKNAEQMNQAGRESAAGQASNLLSQNRQWDQYTQQRIDAENARRAAAANSGPKTFTYIDPDSGQSYELPADW